MNMASSALTHPEWDKETGGLEVAKAFADKIIGKKGTREYAQMISDC